MVISIPRSSFVMSQFCDLKKCCKLGLDILKWLPEKDVCKIILKSPRAQSILEIFVQFECGEPAIN